MLVAGLAPVAEKLENIITGLTAVRTSIEVLVGEVAALKDAVNALRAALPPLLMRPEEVQRRYKLSRTTVWRMCSDGRLKTVRLGGVTLIDVSDLRPYNDDEIEALAAEARR